MMRMAMSPPASALFRALAARAELGRDRVVLCDVTSSDWQSLTFTGERHHLELKVVGRDSAAVVERMCAGLEDAEFSIAGLLVADIGLVGSPRRLPDGATELTIEALTIASD